MLIQCFNVYSCTLIVLGEVAPPWHEAYVEMQVRFNMLYPNCWALQYQSDDRLRHEEFPEILRTESNRYDRVISRGWWPTVEEDSEFDPEKPWNHIFWLVVHGAAQN